MNVVGGGGTTVDLRVSGRIHTGDAGGDGGVWLDNGKTMFVGQNGANVGFWTSGAGWNAFQITNAGNVGIGTTGPAGKLHVSGGNIHIDNNYGLRWDANTDAGSIRFESTGDGTGLSKLIIETLDNANEPIEFRQTGNTRMIIDTSGNVGIGTTSPNEKLEVAGRLKISSSQGWPGLLVEE
ncbi:MAG: hypothetical protein KatS3mg001_095 [Candidatus Pacearchaeota archaeon]|nr:MAG: hypothetical protein KatS3mg001_095 [Candidatus Pacearchaeota archaeon]